MLKPGRRRSSSRQITNRLPKKNLKAPSLAMRRIFRGIWPFSFVEDKSFMPRKKDKPEQDYVLRSAQNDKKLRAYNDEWMSVNNLKYYVVDIQL